jgi:hypothetical protein
MQPGGQEVGCRSNDRFGKSVGIAGHKIMTRENQSHYDFRSNPLSIKKERG